MLILDDICIAKTKGIAAKDVAETGKYPVFGATGLMGYLDTYESENEYVGIIKDGAGVGRTNIYPAKSSLLGTMQYIFPKENIDIKYLMYLLRSLNLGGAAAGAAIPHIYFKNYKKSMVPECDFEKQKLISKLLEKIENLIKLKQKQLFSLDELVKSRFIEMFGDFFNGDSKYPLIKISDVVASKIERASKDFQPDDLIRYVDISSIDNKRNVIVGYTEYIKKEAPSRAQQHVRINDIVISTVRPNLNNVARIHDNYNNIVASSGFCVLRAEKIESDYLFGIVSMQPFANYLNSLTTGANYPAVSDKDILNFMIPNPSNNKQKEYAEFVKQVDKSKFIVQKQIEDLQELLDSKMDEYFG